MSLVLAYKYEKEMEKHIYKTDKFVWVEYFDI